MKYVAILRGINVSGKNLIKMDTLRITMEKIGFQFVSTYIQSGNICFESNLEDTLEIAFTIKNGIEENFNLNVPVLVFKKEEFDKILMENQNINKKSPIIELNNLKNTTFNNKDNRMKVHKKEKQKVGYKMNNRHIKIIIIKIMNIIQIIENKIIKNNKLFNKEEERVQKI